MSTDNTMPKFRFSGVDMSIDVYNDKVEIKPKKNLLGFLGGQGSETILIRNISSVEVRECSFINGGHLMISVNGNSLKENKIEFGGFGDRKSMNESANSIKNFLIEKMNEKNQSKSELSTSDELQKLSKLKDDGILSEEEFKKAKGKLLESL